MAAEEAMNRKLIGLILVGLASFSVQAQTQTTATAGKLAHGCRVYGAIEDGTADQKYSQADGLVNIAAASYCSGFIDGMIGGYSTGIYGTAKEKLYCLPPQVSTVQIARVIARNMEEKPEFEHFSQLAFFLGVMAKTWPCNK